MICYFESTHGCGLRISKDLESAKELVRSECGAIARMQLVREATQFDISWVKSMGGYAPMEVVEIEETYKCGICSKFKTDDAESFAVHKEDCYHKGGWLK